MAGSMLVPESLVDVRLSLHKWERKKYDAHFVNPVCCCGSGVAASNNDYICFFGKFLGGPEVA